MPTTSIKQIRAARSRARADIAAGEPHKAGSNLERVVDSLSESDTPGTAVAHLAEEAGRTFEAAGDPSAAARLWKKAADLYGAFSLALESAAYSYHRSSENYRLAGEFAWADRMSVKARRTRYRLAKRRFRPVLSGRWWTAVLMEFVFDVVSAFGTSLARVCVFGAMSVLAFTELAVLGECAQVLSLRGIRPDIALWPCITSGLARHFIFHVLNVAYFIVVTMTTLGFGDIAPADAGAKMLTGAAVIAGYVVLALLVAVLTSKVRRK